MRRRVVLRVVVGERPDVALYELAGFVRPRYRREQPVYAHAAVEEYAVELFYLVAEVYRGTRLPVAFVDVADVREVFADAHRDGEDHLPRYPAAYRVEDAFELRIYFVLLVFLRRDYEHGEVALLVALRAWEDREHLAYRHVEDAARRLLELGVFFEVEARYVEFLYVVYVDYDDEAAVVEVPSVEARAAVYFGLRLDVVGQQVFEEDVPVFVLYALARYAVHHPEREHGRRVFERRRYHVVVADRPALVVEHDVAKAFHAVGDGVARYRDSISGVSSSKPIPARRTHMQPAPSE